jgi:hypothetical protein
MHRSYSPHAISIFVMLLAILACALPGQTIQPAPVTDPSAISTAVAGTAHAAEQQTQQANPVPATATVVPTDIGTPTPKISVSGTSLSIREDQSTLFTDYKAGIQLIIPAGWMSLRINEEEYLKAFDSEIVLQNPRMLDHLTVIRDHDPKYLRLDAIDIRPGHMPNGILSYLNVIFQPGDVRSLENWERAERDRYHPYAGFKFISSSYPQLANGTRILIIEQSYEAAENKGTIYYRGVFFSLPSGTIVLDFYTNFDFKDTALADFDQAVNSLTSVTP